MELEKRRFKTQEVRIKPSESGTTIAGYAAVFNKPSQTMGGDNPFVEVIAPGAFTNTLRSGADVRLLINHEGLPLARTKSKTLTLREDTIGLWFETTLASEDPDVQRVLPKMRRKDLDRMSFGFLVKKDEWRQVEGRRSRCLLEVELHDISIVTFPAYPQTSVSIRKEANSSATQASHGRRRYLLNLIKEV